MNHVGRKPIILVGSAINAVGIGLQQASSEWKVFLVGRMLNCFGFGVVFTFCPVWFSGPWLSTYNRIGEIARPEVRGFFLCVVNGSIVFGQWLVV